MSHLRLYRYFIPGLLMALAGCSTVLEGSHQRIAVNSVPEGASCLLKSNDDIIAQVPSTPEIVTVQKSKYDIVVECTKAGYVKGKNKNHSDYAITSIGNMAFGQFGVLGSMMDSATGAGSKYDSQVFVELEKAPESVIVQQVIAPPAMQAAAPVASSISEALRPAILPQQQVMQPLQQVAQMTGISAKSATDGTRQPPYDITQ